MCIPFSLKTIKGILLYSSFIVTYNHSDEDRRGVSPILFIDSNFYHNHLYLTVDGRGLVWCVISDDQLMFYTIIQKVICSFFFFQSLLLSKQLIRDFFSDLLHGANEKEFTLLEERWLSEDGVCRPLWLLCRESPNCSPAFISLPDWN